MGGRGSGRWRGLKKKTTVEECPFLDISAILREGLRPEGKVPVFVKARRSVFRKKRVGYIDYELRETRGEFPVIVLSYSVRREGKLQKVEEPIVLQSTIPYFGGLRWWFTCPLAQGNTPCGIRVGMLYLPYGNLYFGCRHCYGLTYRSCQESHKRDFLADLILERIPEITVEEAKYVSSIISI